MTATANSALRALESGDVDSIRFQASAVLNVELPGQLGRGQTLVPVAVIRRFIFLHDLRHHRIQGAAVIFKFCV